MSTACAAVHALHQQSHNLHRLHILRCNIQAWRSIERTHRVVTIVSASVMPADSKEHSFQSAVRHNNRRARLTIEQATASRASPDAQGTLSFGFSTAQVDSGYQLKRPARTNGDVAPRVFDLLSGGGNGVKAHVREEKQRGAVEDATGATRRKPEAQQSKRCSC